MSALRDLLAAYPIAIIGGGVAIVVVWAWWSALSSSRRVR